MKLVCHVAFLEMASDRCRNKREYMELLSYCDMGFGALSIFCSTLIFINNLPLSREGHELLHDVITISFMTLMIFHFLQLLQAVRLLNSTEHHNFEEDPEQSIRLANSWQCWCVFFLLLLLVKLYIVHRCYGRTFSFMIYSAFIGLEFMFRVHSRYSVKEFIFEIENSISEDHRY